MRKSKLQKYIITGHLLINIPAIIFSFGLPFLAYHFLEGIPWKISFSIIGFIVGIAISWLWWSFIVTKWRLWAFSRVDEDEWYELKELAVKNRLIWEQGSYFERTEIQTKKEAEKITHFKQKVVEQEQIEEIKRDLRTPRTLKFQYNKKETITETISKVFLLLVSIGLILTQQYILGVILLAIILFYGDGYKMIFQIFKNEDYLIINNQGIYLKYPKERSIYWEDIREIALEDEGRLMWITVKEYESVEKIKCELWRFNIKDFRVFSQQLKVFIDRFIYERRDRRGEES